ncbi:TrbI/VirB10 family protein, partial [Vibrio parahaemolyticus]
MNSTVAGMTKCTLTRNIYSDNGTTLLLERGSELTGEYRANVSQGQSRLFVLWDRVKTPHGVVIDLASPATDSLGAG